MNIYSIHTRIAYTHLCCMDTATQDVDTLQIFKNTHDTCVGHACRTRRGYMIAVDVQHRYT